MADKSVFASLRKPLKTSTLTAKTGNTRNFFVVVELDQWMYVKNIQKQKLIVCLRPLTPRRLERRAK